MEFCVKGWNWGVAMFHGSLLKFMVGSTPAFEIPLREVSQVLWRGKILAGFTIVSFPDRVCLLAGYPALLKSIYSRASKQRTHLGRVICPL